MNAILVHISSRYMYTQALITAGLHRLNGDENRLPAIFQETPSKNVSILCGGDNWSYQVCKAPVESSPSPNQHPTNT